MCSSVKAEVTADAEPVEQAELKDEVVLSFSYGLPFSLAPGLPMGSSVEDIEPGIRFEDLLEKVLIHRPLNEELFVDFDYLSERNRDTWVGEGNTYSLIYRGSDDAVLQELSLGNKYLSITGDRFTNVDQGNTDSYALRGIFQHGDFGIEGLVRYDIASEGSRRFRGQRRIVTSNVPDVGYVKGRFFLLPDKRIDEGSLIVLKSSSGASYISVDGRGFSLLNRHNDYRFDNSAGRLDLIYALSPDEELIIYYEKDGMSAGSPILGQNAIIDTDGMRRNFNSFDFGNYFTDSGYLYLKKNGMGSYWEMRNGYYLEGLMAGQLPEELTVSLLRTSDGSVNTHYEALLADLLVDPDAGVLFFSFEDEVGFYPRPFPGEYPYTHPTEGSNPFDPDNPVYGGADYPGPENSLHELKITYALAEDRFFLDYDIIAGSVRVILDGATLGSHLFSVDYETGIIRFSEGIVGPFSDIEVYYRYMPFAGGEPDFFTGLGLSYSSDRLNLRNLSTYSLPIEGTPSPYIGEERASFLSNSSSVRLSLGMPEEEEGLRAAVNGGVAGALSWPNSRGSAIVADMDGDHRHTVSMKEADWILGSRSLLLPAADIDLSSRGSVLYENYWKSTVLSGDILQPVSWDNSENPAFSYDEKAGPYNSADKPLDGNDRSLVIEYDILAGSTEAYVSLAANTAGAELDFYERFNMVYRGEDIEGDDLQIFVELLSVYQEDLNGNDELDGEEALDSAGFGIAPIGGGSTVIGSDRFGRPNGRVDSEDLNRNGYLDPIGIFPADQESGLILNSSADSAPTLILSQGTGDWKRLSLDIHELATEKPEIFREPRVLRITVKPVQSEAAVRLTGKILINRMWFSASGMINRTPQSISAEEVAVGEDPSVTALSQSFPSVYDKLHGGTRYRSDQGHTEKLLMCRVLPVLPAGEKAVITRRFDASADLSSYRTFGMYVFLPAGVVLPEDGSFTIAFLAGGGRRLDGLIPMNMIRTGWNEIRIHLEEDYDVEVNGNVTGRMKKSGGGSVLSRVKEIDFGFAAGQEDVADEIVFWLDEWHVSEIRPDLDLAHYVDVTIGYSGGLLPVSAVPVFSDPNLTLGYEVREGHFLDRKDWKNLRYFGSTGVDLFDLILLDWQLSREEESPVDDGGEEIEVGEETDRYSHLVAVHFENPFFPLFEHEFHRSAGRTHAVDLFQGEYLAHENSITRESIIFRETFLPIEELEQHYSFSRNWFYQDGSFDEPLESPFTDEVELTQAHEGGVSFTSDRVLSSLNLLRDEAYSSTFPEQPLPLLPSYSTKLAGIFKAADSVIPGGKLLKRRDTARILLGLPRRRRFGLSLDLEIGYLAFQYDHENETRNTESEHGLSLAFPFSPGGQGVLEIVPEIGRTFGSDYGGVGPGLSEGNILLSPLSRLFMPPFYYLSPAASAGRRNELEALDIFDKDVGSMELIQGHFRNSMETRLGLEAFVDRTEWFIPSRIAARVEGKTFREGAAYSQQRTFTAGLGKTGQWIRSSGVSSVSFSLDVDYARTLNFAEKLREQSIGLYTGFGFRRDPLTSFSLNLSASYSRRRQRLYDKGLVLPAGYSIGTPIVPVRPSRDVLGNVLFVTYAWERAGQSMSTPNQADPNRAERIVNTERMTLESNILISDVLTTADSGIIPFRITLEHDTVFIMSNNLEFDFNLKSVIGMEERIELENRVILLPAMGFEFKLSARFRF